VRKFILSIILITLFASCDKENEHPVPNVPIYIEPIHVFPGEPLSVIYGKIIVPNTGYAGNGVLIVNIGYDESGQYKFMAYDATCPYEVKQGCIVLEDKSSISLVECSCCESKYEITFGAVSVGPSNYPLKTYRTAFNGEYLRVYN